MFDVIAFDADDTLWHNETLFTLTQDRFRKLLEPHLRREWTGQELLETEVRNLRYYGYGVKGFVLSMIETAIELTDGTLPPRKIQEIIDFGKGMISAPVQLLDQVEETIPELARSYTLMIITKGDLFDQEAKIAQSGLVSHFKHIEIISDKSTETYQGLLAKYGIEPRRFLMVGNSLRSDILPVLQIGAQAVYVPYEVTWAHELVSRNEVDGLQYYELEHIGRLPALLEQLQRQSFASQDRLQEK